MSRRYDIGRDLIELPKNPDMKIKFGKLFCHSWVILEILKIILEGDLRMTHSKNMKTLVLNIAFRNFLAELQNLHYVHR